MRRSIACLLLFTLVLPGLEAAQPVRARKAMVVSREANATDAGVAVLKAGVLERCGPTEAVLKSLNIMLPGKAEPPKISQVEAKK